MARIRTIKPDFWTDGNMVKLSPFARLLYIGMWNFTMCDYGHVADDAMKLKLQVLPMDDVDINELLLEVMNAGRVVRIVSDDGRTFLHVKRFGDHQKIDPRWKTRCQACGSADLKPLPETQGSLGELPVTPKVSPPLPLGREGMGRESKKTSSNAAHSKEFDSFWEHYPRKVGKLAAKTAFSKALSLTDVSNIQEALRRLHQEVRGQDQKFIPHPATWLNQGRWDDEPTQQPKSAWTKEFHNG